MKYYQALVIFIENQLDRFLEETAQGETGRVGDRADQGGDLVVRLVECQGHRLKKHGKDYALNCPFHEDRTASLIITPKTNLWYCLGACGVGGSVIDWVMKSQGVNCRFACELLQKDLGLVLEAGTKATRQSTTTKVPPPFTLKGTGAADADSQTALKQVIDYFHETLKQSPEALEYNGIDANALAQANRPTRTSTASRNVYDPAGHTHWLKLAGSAL